MKYKHIFIGLLLCSGCWGTAYADQENWKTSFPPTLLDLDYVITQAFAKKFNATLSSNKVPFARRLFQLKTGEIDLLSGLLKKDDRERYAYFITPHTNEKRTSVSL
jgi:polar amino acid transport system substrate-binding protein